jgi:hypothetical protein
MSKKKKKKTRAMKEEFRVNRYGRGGKRRRDDHDDSMLRAVGI